MTKFINLEVVKGEVLEQVTAGALIQPLYGVKPPIYPLYGIKPPITPLYGITPIK
jgi:hypothetical protein